MVVYDLYPTKNKKFKGKIWTFLSIIFVVAILGAVTGIYLEYIQWNEIGGFESIFMTNLYYKILFVAISFLIIFLALFVSTIYITKNIHIHARDMMLEKKKLPKYLPPLIFSVLGALVTKEVFYEKALLFLNNVSFNKNVPLFDLDVGYFIFQRPFLMTVYDFISTLWIFVIIYTVAYYILGIIYSVTGSLDDMTQIKSKVFKVRSVLRHCLVNVAVFFVIKAFSYKFQKEEILYSNVVDVQGAGFIDVNIWLKYYYVAPVLIIAIVIASMYFMWKGSFKKAGYTIAIFPLLSVLVSIVAGITQTFFVVPNQFDYEKEYLQYNIEKTREAYNLDKINVVDFPQIKELTPDVIKRNPETMNSIRIIDYSSTLASNAQLQNITNFYTFTEGDIINYQLDGKDVPVFITAREIDKTKLSSKTYINTTFKYTHGYGVVINPINKIIPGGQVDYILSGLSSEKIKRPEIYYGELTKDYVIVNAGSGLKEIDFDSEKETTYTGNGGIKLNLLNRLLFAAKYGDINMIISGYVANDSRILLNREIVERTKKVLPFLEIDRDPYIVIDDTGRLKWILDGYTTTSKYPYAQRIGDINYIRNSVKIVVDAYNGDAKAYVIDENDPIIKAYSKMYPGILKPKSEFPKDLEKYSKYPETLFKIQTELMKRYHLDSSRVSDFFTRQDLWDIGKHTSKNIDEAEYIEPYYNMIKLPKVSEREEFILMRPFTPYNKNNMVSWLSVRNSHNKYGEMVLYRFPKNTNTFGTSQIGTKINQQDEISKDMTLWGQRGSDVYKGDLMVIPIEDSILYVEPIYVRSSGERSIPEIKKVVVAYQRGEEFIYGSGLNLQAALDSLFKGVVKPKEEEKAPNAVEKPAKDEDAIASEEPSQEDIYKDIANKYDAIKKELDSLGELLEKIER